jgi:hypothetical protein
MSLTVRIKVPAGLSNYKQIIDMALEKGMDRAVDIVQNTTKSVVPVISHHLQSSIVPVLNPGTGKFVGKIIQDSGMASYGRFVNDGTGIYGPEGRPITPTTKPLLKWKGSNGQWHSAKSVRGMKPRKYMQKGLADSVDKVRLAYSDEIARAIKTLGGG